MKGLLRLVFVVAACLFCASGSGADVPLNFVGQYGGDCFCVAASGNTAYVGYGPRLLTLNISNAANPTLIGRSPVLSGVPRDVVVSGSYAYVVSSSGLQILDVSNASSPTVVGSYPASECNGIAISGSYAYIAAGSGLLVLNITNAASPTYVSSFSTGNAANDVFVAGGYAYLASNGLQIVSISDPATPSLVGSCDVTGGAFRVEVSGNYAYVAANLEGLQIINVANPAAPSRISGYSPMGNAYGVTISGNYAYVTSWGWGLFVIDVSNPASPSLVVRCYNALWGHNSAALSGGYAYVPGEANGLRVVDPTSEWNTGTPYRESGPADYVAASGSYAYTSQMDSGLDVISISNPANPSRVGGYDPGDAREFAISGNYAYLMDYFDGLNVLNISNPASPARVGGYDTPDGFDQGISVFGNYAYVKNGNTGFIILNISNPSSPNLAGQYSCTGSVTGIVVSGSLAYISLAGATEDMQVIDISNVSSPVRLGGYTFPGTYDEAYYGLAVLDHYAYVTSSWTGLIVLDVSDPANPVRVGQYDPSEGSVSDAVAADGRIYLARGDNGVEVLDVSDPASPAKVGWYNTADYAYRLAVYGSNMFVADSSGGLVVLSIGVPTYGSLRATISPASAVSAGAQWRRTGTSTWLNSGATETNIPVGSYDIEFKTVSGYVTPSLLPVTINANQLTEVTASYSLAPPTEVITIGTGTGTWNYPLSTFYHDARTQIIYLSSELGGPRTITSLSLDVSTLPGQIMNAFTIRMKHTDLSAYITSSTWESTGWTTVYAANQTMSSTGWNEFSFPTPFTYNGTQNLMVDISFNNSSYTSDGYCRYSLTGAASRSMYYRTDSGSGDPLAWSGISPTRNLYAGVPNIRLRCNSTATGSLTATLTPAEAVAAGAQWRRTGTSTWLNSGATEADVPVGPCTVEFKDVSGWSKPADQEVTINLGQTATVSASYTQQTGPGSLRVTIAPAEAVTAGAQWRRTGTSTWLDSGATETGIDPGEYSVEFSDVEGWSKPGDLQVTVNMGALTEASAGYSQEIIIGSGTDTWELPLNTSNYSARTQMIYLASEIGDWGILHSLALDVVQIPGQTLNNFTIRLKHTDIGEFGYPSNLENDGWATVYQADETIAEIGWHQFNFTTPFECNGLQNLMVDISFQNTSSSVDGFCAGSYGPVYRSIAMQDWGGYGGDPLEWAGEAWYCTSFVPNLKLGLEGTAVAAPACSPDSGTYNDSQTVSVSCATPVAVIHYTTNGIDPTQSDPTIASGGSLAINSDTTLKARAWLAGVGVSNMKTATYSFVTAAPVCSPLGGSYTTDQTVTITCATPGAEIHYTTNGAEPTQSDPVIASGGTVVVDREMWLMAKAWSSSYPESSTTTEYYYMYVATPTFMPDGGGFSSAQSVTINCETSGAEIHYSTNGVDPTLSDPVVLSGGSVVVPISPTTTLKAKAWRTGYTTSSVKSALYRPSATYHVSTNGDDSKDGLTWANAKKTVQAAIDASGTGDEIWVKSGTYTPTSGTTRSVSFTLKAGLALYGGFAGDETSRSDRDWTSHETILSGDIGAQGDNSDNSFTVVKGATGAMLDGFTVTGGNSGNDSGYHAGGGINGSIRAVNCTISGNTAGCSGGGVYCYNGSVTLERCRVVGNNAVASSYWAAYGGGVEVSYGSLSMDHCEILQNTARDGGGGVRAVSCSAAIANSSVCGNVAASPYAIGGGIYAAYYYGSPLTDTTISNCVIAGNTASSGAGTFANNNVRMINTTVAANAATSQGGGVRNYGNLVLDNTIVALNSSDVYSEATASAVAHNCLISDSTGSLIAPGNGNILGTTASPADPLFVRTPSKGPDALWGTSDDDYGDLRMQSGSPCIDAGDNSLLPPTLTTDIAGNPRIANAIVDMGAYEYLALTPVSVLQAKTAAEGDWVSIDAAIVSAAWTDSLYIQGEGSYCGLRVEKTAHGITGDNVRVNIVGQVFTNYNGERYIQASSVIPAGNGSVAPLGMPARWLGGGSLLDSATGFGQDGITGVQGLNNIGLLVRVWGTVSALQPVTAPDQPIWFTLDGGNGRLFRCIAQDGSPAIDPLWLGKSAIVTGISSCEAGVDSLISVILVKKGPSPIIY